MEPSEISSGCFLAVLEREKDTKKVPAKDMLASAAAQALLDGIVEEKPKEEVKKQKVKQRTRKVTASDSKPKAATLLKAEVSKAANKIQEKHVCPVCTKKPTRKIQEKHVSPTKGASDTPQKTVHGKKTASNTPQKTVHSKKAASNIQQKNVHQTKAASNTSTSKAAS